MKCFYKMYTLYNTQIMVCLYISYLSPCCRKIPDKSNVGKKGLDLAHSSKGPFILSGRSRQEECDVLITLNLESASREG